MDLLQEFNLIHQRLNLPLQLQTRQCCIIYILVVSQSVQLLCCHGYKSVLTAQIYHHPIDKNHIIVQLYLKMVK